MSCRDLTPWKRRRRSSNVESSYPSIQALDERMDRLFDEFFGPLDPAPLSQPRLAGSNLAPQIDVSECDTAYRFSAELPGVDEKDVEVTLTNGVLTIKGEKMSETVDGRNHFLRTERSYGAFQRSFSLPSDIDEEKVEAAFCKGVLNVTIAKCAKSKSATRRIEVRSA